MAQLALGFVGSAIGSSIGGTVLGISASAIGGYIGATVGGMLDNMAQRVTGGPKLSDLTVQTSTLGSPIPLLFGPENRLAGNMIWLKNNQLDEHKHQGGKKKGASNAIATGGLSLIAGGGLGLALISGGATFLKNKKTPAGYTYSATFAISFGDARLKAANKLVRIYLNGKLYWSNDGSVKDSKMWSSIKFYTGAHTQSPDPVIESVLGVGNTPAYRGTVYVVFENLQLADFGNQIPTVEAVINNEDRLSVRGALQRIVDLSGIPHNIAGSFTAQGEVRGYTIGSQSSAIAAIQPLALAYNFDSAEVSGHARFCSRGLPAAGVIPTGDLAAYGDGEDQGATIQWQRGPETDLPREATVTFKDPARDWQPNSQTSTRMQGSADSNVSNEVAIVLTPDQGKQISDRMLWEAWNARTTAQVQASDRWIQSEAGRVYLFETPAGLEPLRLKQRTRGANGVIEMTVVRDRPDVYRSSQSGAFAGIVQQQVEIPAPTKMVVMDCPLLRDIDDNDGFYWSVAETEIGWRGAAMMVSLDDDTYDAFGYVGYKNLIATCVTTLGDGVTNVIDNENTLRVSVVDPQSVFVQISESDLLKGGNLAWIGPASGEGGEIVQFMNAEVVTPGVWDLSGFTRGRLGTEYTIGNHGANELLVMLVQTGVSRLNFNRKDWNTELFYKAVTLLTDESDATAVPFTNTGEGRRCLSPVHVEAVKDQGTGDFVVTWFRRSRLRSTGIGNGDLPLGEAEETYEVDIYKGATFKRTLTATTTTVTYTAANQMTDGFVGGNTITFNVYQTNAPRGRGHVAVGKVVK